MIAYVFAAAAPLAAIIFLLLCYPTRLARWAFVLGGLGWLLMVLTWMDP